MNGLRLNSLKLHGFKSFASAVELAFPDGIVAIVGPNGSGKSNVADAVRWVLGEQSLKALRGANLQDVIFAGSDQKRALGMAEVSIEFDNSGRELPLDYDEVRITRRAFRSGDSEFEINDGRCRLRDIQELFLDTGLGKGAFSLVGQGEIDAVLSAQPTERRLILEEAAGIARYRQRRAETEKELIETEANLARIEDVAAEVRLQLEPLAAERDRARAYRELATRRDALERDLGLHEWRRLEAQSTELSEQADAAVAQAQRRTGERDAAEAAEAAAAAALKAVQTELEAALEGLRSAERAEAEARHRCERCDGERERAARSLEDESARLAQATAAAAEARAKLGELETALATKAAEAETAGAQSASRGEAARVAEQERSDAERAVEVAEGSLRRAEAEAASLAAAQTAAEQALAGARDRRGGTDGDAKSLVERLAIAEARLSSVVAEREAAQSELRGADASLGVANAEREAAERHRDECQSALAASARAADERAARERALTRLEEAGEGYFHGVRAVLTKQAALDGLLGPVARLIGVPERLERAIDTALGGAQQHIVARNEQAIARAIDYLKQNRAGRATFLPVDTVRKSELRPEELRVLREAEGVVGPACELIEIVREARPAIEHVLGRVVVMEDLAKALTVAKRLGGSVRLTTLDGELINPGGAITGGSANRAAGALLARQRELATLRAQLGEDRIRAGELEAAVAEAAVAVDGARGELERRREARAAAQQRCARCESECEQLTARIAELNADRARLDEREAQAEREIAAEAERLRALTAKAAEAATVHAERQAALESARRARAAAAHSAQAAQTAWADARLAAAEAARARDGLARERQDCEARIAREQAAARTASDQSEQRRAEIARLERDAAAFRDAAATAEARRGAAQGGLDGARAERDGVQAELERIGADCRATRARAERALQEAQVAAAQMERALEQLAAATARLAEMGVEAPAQMTPASPLGAGELRDELERLRGEIDALGPINPAAEQAWQALAERSAYLESQQADLSAAQGHLHDAIRRIDETSRARLAESFAAVNAAFGEIFVELFGGGDARLAWSEGDILDAGLDVWVRLPGKRVQNLVALSGGERALSAIAFLFAVLRVKPSPFCVLDEIDAALDDANLARFGRVLRTFTEHTQFIVITHRQVTIETADVLYGVTMAAGGASSVISLRLDQANEHLAQSEHPVQPVQ